MDAGAPNRCRVREEKELKSSNFVKPSDGQTYLINIFSCGLAANYTEYCNRTVTKWLTQSDHELNEQKRLGLVKKIGKTMSNDVPMIPLFQRPTYLVYKTSVHGLVDNPSSQGPSFNAENWSKK